MVAASTASESEIGVTELRERSAVAVRKPKALHAGLAVCRDCAGFARGIRSRKSCGVAELQRLGFSVERRWIADSARIFRGVGCGCGAHELLRGLRDTQDRVR